MYIVGGQSILDALDRMGEKIKVREIVKKRLINDGFYADYSDEDMFNLAWSREYACKYHHLLLNEFGFEVHDVWDCGMRYEHKETGFKCFIYRDDNQRPVQYYLVLHKPY